VGEYFFKILSRDFREGYLCNNSKLGFTSSALWPPCDGDRLRHRRCQDFQFINF
jgi:hypothetical protein